MFSIGHQDDTGPWIHENFPDLFYIVSIAPKGQDMRRGAYRGMYLGGDETLTSRDWVDRNLRNNRGPLAALYPTNTWTAPNPHSTLKEGDTPSWFYFLPNGLGDPNHPEWGSWGGRFRKADGGLDLKADSFPAHRRSFTRWALQYLEGITARPPQFGCFGLHEWAMVYRAAEVRHPRTPLRVSPETVAATVESASGQVDLGPLTRVAAPVAAAPPPAPVVRPAPKPPAQQNGAASTVYRSGVIDGMAYTLFMDGSIQAELPQGTVKFANIDDLQKYLLGNR